MAAELETKPEAFGLSRWDDMEDDAPVLDSADGEHIAKLFESVHLVLGSNFDLGPGNLFITTRYVLSLVCSSVN
jgi:hypothetical protein